MDATKPAGRLASPLTEWLAVLRGWWRAYKHRREWTPERQLENLRNMVQADHRWLAHDKTADMLTCRYLAALAPNWMSVVHTDPRHFRRELGLEPVTAFTKINSPENMARMNRIARGEPQYKDGPLPETGWD